MTTTTETVLDLPCDRCNADPGEQCRTPKGTATKPHKSRRNALADRQRAERVEPVTEAGEHDWQTLFDSEPWQGPEKGRWCPRCGHRVRDLAATESEGAPACTLPHEYTIALRAIRTFSGMEGTGFSATLLVNGAKVGEVYDDARGGSYGYRIPWELQQNLDRWARVKTQQAFEPLDTLVSKAVSAEEERRWLKRHTRKKTVVKLKGQGRDEWTIYKAPYTPEFAARLRAKHKDLVEIANEREGV